MIIWIVLAIVVAGVSVFVASRFFRDRDVELGLVSQQWIAEQRFGHAGDPQR